MSKVQKCHPGISVYAVCNSLWVYIVSVIALYSVHLHSPMQSVPKNA